jgi:hypothetical protein
MGTSRRRRPEVAIINWHGKEYVGEPVRLLEDGTTWRFKMHQHGPRWAAGSEIDVRQSEIVEMAAAETPMVRDAGAAALEADRAREREALPSVQDLIASARKDGTVVNPKPEEFLADG